MTPLTFSIENAVEILPDDIRRILASEARKFADAGHTPRRLWREPHTIQQMMISEHKRIVWVDAYAKRRARIARMRK